MTLPVISNNRFHDTYGIKQSKRKSIPFVSDRNSLFRHDSAMPTNDIWRAWGKRFRVQAKEKGKTLAQVGERMDLAESTIRSWTNGHREINLTDFFRLCEAAEVDAAHVLFGQIGLNAEQKKAIGTLFTSFLEADPSVTPGYVSVMDGIRADKKRHSR